MKRAILVFLKLPVPGRVKTRLAAALGDEGAARAYEQLVSRVFDQCRQANPDRIAIAFDPPGREAEVKAWLAPWLDSYFGEIQWIPQCDGDLGSRLESGVEAVFGDDETVALAVVGTDCVHIDPPVFKETWTSLENGNDIVFGPTEDGGYYLIGMKALQRAVFREIPWSAENTYEASIDAALGAGLTTHILPSRIDVDTIDEWLEVESEVVARRAVFFDRDGVVNCSPGDGYVLSADDFSLNEGIHEALLWLKKEGWLAIVVTSQKGVGKGLLSHEELDRIHRKMQTRLAKRGASFDGIYVHTGEPDCAYPAKPDPSMIDRACERFFIDPRQSWIIGDADRDIAMGDNAGLKGTIRILGDKPVTVSSTHELDDTIEIPELLRKVL